MVFQIGPPCELKSSRIVYAAKQALCSSHVIRSVFYYTNYNRHIQKLIQHCVSEVYRNDCIHCCSQLALPDGFRRRFMVHCLRAIHNDDHNNVFAAFRNGP